MRTRIGIAMMMAVLWTGSTGCAWFKRKKPQPAPAPQVTQPAPQPEAPKVEPKPPVQPPPAEVKPPELQPPTAKETPVIVLPAPAPKVEPKPPQKKPRTSSRRSPKQQPPVEAPAPAPLEKTEPAPEEAVTPQPPPPKLGEMLTPEEARQYEASLQRDMTAAREALSKVGRRRLTRDQAETVSRVESFLKQAEEARETDLRTAAHLATRAALLGKDLVDSLQ